jgi:hypothetical protein
MQNSGQIGQKALTANGRFGARRGVRPQKVLSDSQAFTPARAFEFPMSCAKPPDVGNKLSEAQLKYAK